MNSQIAPLINSVLEIEKLRVASQVRQSHLALQNRTDAETDELLIRLTDLEDYVDGRISQLLKGHPAYDWFSCVKGIGKENIGKVVGLIDIERAPTISALWKFCGFSVENGQSPKRIKGEKLSYNSRLRSMCWRVGSSLMKAKGKFYDYYLNEKGKYIQKYENEGRAIVPATKLPKEGGKKTETEEYISEGHVHNQALRKMIKLFLACLWLVWREAEGLPVTAPYAIDKLGHNSLILPWDMTDKAKRRKKTTLTERATHPEETRSFKRAMAQEKTNPSERARELEETNFRERAIPLKQTSKIERATNREKTNISERIRNE